MWHLCVDLLLNISSSTPCFVMYTFSCLSQSHSMRVPEESCSCIMMSLCSFSISDSTIYFIVCGANTEGCHIIDFIATNGHRQPQHQGLEKVQASRICTATWSEYPWEGHGIEEKHFVFIAQNMTVLSAWGSKDCLQGVDKLL